MANIRKIEGKTGISYQITVSTVYLSKGKQKRYYKTWSPAAGMTDRQIEKMLSQYPKFAPAKVPEGVFKPEIV